MLQTMLIKSDGHIISMKPKKGKTFDLEELQTGVNGMIEALSLPSHKAWMIVNEEGKLLGLEVNRQATEIWWNERKKQKLPTDDVIVGNVLIIQLREIE